MMSHKVSKINLNLAHSIVVGVNIENVVYYEWVPTGMFMKTLGGSVSLLGLCVLLITIALGVAIQNPLLIVALASALAFVLFLFWNYRGM
jgi:hypothetical protein